jgi:hypothetical protein
LTTLRSAPGRRVSAELPRGQLAGGPALGPGLAACSKIAIGVTMGYMLLVML